MVKWTKSQQNAIDARNRNILVSAAAGSGKTAVLVERVKKIITDKDNPVPIDSLLIVTYTNAAAAEMKSRISKALGECIKEHPNDSFYRNQLSLLTSAKICTIDSFCGNLVREYFYDLDISQDFTTLEESELEILENSVISDTINDFFKSGDNEFIKLIEAYTTPSSDKAFIDVIKKILRFIYALPFPDKWLDMAVERYNPDIPFTETVWFEYANNEIRKLLEYGISLVKDNIACIDTICPEDKNVSDKFDTVLNNDLILFQEYINAFNTSWDSMINLPAASFDRIPYSKKVDANAYFTIKSNRESYKSIISDDISSLLISSEEDYKNDAKIIYSTLKRLVEIVKEVDKRLFNEKKERNGYSFSDIEHFAIKLLFDYDDKGNIVKKPLAQQMSKQYYEILVDEYQDTNEAQDLLFTYLSNGRNLFTVGDIKQSIYRFRLAMPDIFNSKKKKYRPYDESDDELSSKIILDKNFRSRKEICSYVNYVFSNTMSEETGELDYGEEEYLNNGRDYPDTGIPSAQINIITGAKGEELNLKEAAEIAKLILDKVNRKELIQDGDTQRPVRFGDFAILMRNLKSRVNDYSRVLAEFGIPVICENATGLFENNEIRMLLSLLRAIDNPTQDIPLLATLMSPMYAFSPDDLAEIRINTKGKNLFKSISLSNSEKCKAFISELSDLRKISVTMSVSSFIRFLVEENGFISYINAMGNGEQRYQNVLKLISFAKSFDNGSNVGLTSFLRYIDKIAQSDKKIESSPLSGSFSDAVTIMTIHKSKGLEFPICILAGTAKTYNKRELSSKILVNSHFGIGMKIHDEEQFCQYATLPYAVMKRKCANELMSENLRVLYVALTRAKEQFITFISCDKADKKLPKLAVEHLNNGGISPYACSRITSDGDLLLLCALMHQNGNKLRELGSCPIDTKNADYKLSVNIIEAPEYEKPEEKYDFVSHNESVVKEIKNKLNYTYKDKELEFFSSKLTASELDINDNNYTYITSSKPAFMNKEGLTPAQRGTAMHTFMQFCDYSSAKHSLDDEIERLVIQSHLSPEQASALDRGRLNAFFSSHFAERIYLADNVYRELKLASFVSADTIYNTTSKEKILIQGIADCVFEEDGELILLDYKTDRVNSEYELLDRYKKQLMFYRNAVEKALGKRVKEVVLYSFSLNKPCYYK